MKQYKHYSFDLWGTLLKPNPAFSEARIEYFYDHFNPKKKSHAEIQDIFRKVSYIHNTTAECTGLGFKPVEMYSMVLYFLGHDMTFIKPADLQSICNVMEPLFLKHCPFLFEDTGKVLSTLKERGCTLSVLSNTGYASGRTMKKVLEKLDISRFFDFLMFSDDLCVSKPDELIFYELICAVRKYNFGTLIELSDIIHVGDSVKADINGANNARITGFGVHFNGITLKNLLD